MKIKHEEGAPSFRPLSIAFTVENLEELKSLRALFGGCDAKTTIEASATPSAPLGPARVFVQDVAEILNAAARRAGEVW